MGRAQLFAMFCVTVLVYVPSARYTCNRTTQIVERCVAAHQDPASLRKSSGPSWSVQEHIGIAEISDRIMENMSVISESASRGEPAQVGVHPHLRDDLSDADFAAGVF